MPIYEFECSKGHRFEKIFSIGNCPSNLLCEYCPMAVPDIISKGSIPSFAEKVPSAPANINIGKPTIIFRNSKNPNDVQVATSSTDKAPFGFVTEELKNPIERSKFERERQKDLELKNEIITESVRIRDNETRKDRHAEINANMSNLPDDGTRELMKFAMQRTRKKKERTKKSTVRLDINHIDSSNLIK